MGAVPLRGIGVVSLLLLAVSLLLQGVALGAQDESTRSADTAGADVPTAVPAFRRAERVAVLSVHGVIDQITLMSLERRVKEAIEQGAAAIVFDIDTPGGRVDSARDIEHLIKNDAGVNTVAWINTDAFSAGTLIALACREIVVHPTATWGDCAPIAIGTAGLIAMPAAERAKQEGPLRASVVDSARRNGYDERLVEAFIAVGVELWMLENTDTGERIFVDRAEYRRVFDEEPPQNITSATPPGSGRGQQVLPFFDQHLRDTMLDGPAPTEEQMRESIEEAQRLPSPRKLLTSADRDDWTLISQVISNDKLLVVDSRDSINFGLANATIANEQELKAFFGATTLTRMDESWSEQLVRFMISGWVRTLLILLFVVCAVIEFALPGTGVFGIVAAVTLLLLIGAPFLAGMAQWWEILLIVGGMALIAIEVFILPGLGVAGVSGVVCVLVGVVGTFVTGDVQSVQGQNELYVGLAATAGGIIAGGIAIWLLARHLYDAPFFQKFILSGAGEHEAAAAAAVAASSSSTAHVVQPDDSGTADTDLRPSGRAFINGRMIDVVTSGGYVKAGTRVVVTAVDRYRIEVEAVE